MYGDQNTGRPEVAQCRRREGFGLASCDRTRGRRGGGRRRGSGGEEQKRRRGAGCSEDSCDSYCHRQRRWNGKVKVKVKASLVRSRFSGQRDWLIGIVLGCWRLMGGLRASTEVGRGCWRRTSLTASEGRGKRCSTARQRGETLGGLSRWSGNEASCYCVWLAQRASGQAGEANARVRIPPSTSLTEWRKLKRVLVAGSGI